MAWLTIKQASQYINTSEKILREKARAGKIPAYKPFGKWLFNSEEIENFIKTNQNAAGQCVRHEDNISCQNKSYQRTNAAKYGGTHTQRRASKEYEDLLKAPTGRKQKNLRQGNIMNHGG